MTIISTETVSINKIKARWEEPYTSGTINRNLSVLPAGIHHGFRIVPFAAQTVAIATSSLLGESLGIIRSRPQRFVFSAHETDEPTFDLSASVGTRVWLFLYVNYQTGVPTTAEYRVVDSTELSEAWTLSALLLGSVRVPSTGNIEIGHIDHGSASYAGLSGETGGSNGWNLVSDNPYFDMGVAGWQASNTDYIQLGGTGEFGPNSIIIGDSSGSGGGNNASVLKTINNIRTGDLICVRIRAKASSVSNGVMFLLMDGGAVYQTILSENLASYEWFGFVYEMPVDRDSATFGIDVELPAGADTGLFEIDVLEIWTKRLDESMNKNARPTLGMAFSDIELKNGTTHPESGKVFWSEADKSIAFSDGNTLGTSKTSFPLTTLVGGVVDRDLTLDPNARCLVGAANSGFHANSALSFALTSVVLSGGTVSDASGNLNVTQCIYWKGIGENYRYGVVPSILLSPGVGSWVVVVDGSDGTIKAIDSSTYTASPQVYVGLAYAEISAGPTVDVLQDIRHYLKGIDRNQPLTVGPSRGAFNSLDDALKFKELTESNQEIVIVQDLFINGSNVNQMVVPPGTRIRGAHPGITITVSNISTYLFDVSAPLSEGVGREFAFEDLIFVGGIGGSSLFGLAPGNIPPRTLKIRNIKLGSYLGQKFDHLLEFPNGMDGDSFLEISNCYIWTDDTCLTYLADGTSASNQNVNISGTTFIADTTAVTVFDLQIYQEVPHKISINNVAFRGGTNDTSRAMILGHTRASDIVSEMGISFGGVNSGVGFANVAISNILIDRSVKTYSSMSIGYTSSCRLANGSITGITYLGPDTGNQIISASYHFLIQYCPKLVLSGVNFHVDSGSCIEISDSGAAGTSRITMTGFNLKSDDSAGNGVLLSNLKSAVLTTFQAEGFADESAVFLDTCNDCLVMSGVITEAVAAGDGTTISGGAGNVVSDTYVVTP